jgi:hypothetical protein
VHVAVSKTLDSRKWREFYLVESGSSIAALRRRLFNVRGNCFRRPETTSDAMYILHGLRSTCKRTLNMSERSMLGMRTLQRCEFRKF